MAKPKVRCPWAGDDPLYHAYHDEEWGRPLHDDRALFELLNLEGAQAGLSWITILRKRPAYRRAPASMPARSRGSTAAGSSPSSATPASSETA